MEEVESNYQEVVFDYLHATAYQGTPLGRTILGPVENVKSLQSRDLRSFIQTNYKAPRMVLAAAGGVDHTELKELGEQYFGDISGSSDSKSPALEPCRFTGSEIRDRDDAMPLAHVALALEGPGWVDPDTLALMVGSCINGAWDRTHGGGSNLASPLASKFFDSGNVHSYQHFFTCYHDTSLWCVNLATQPARLLFYNGITPFFHFRGVYFTAEKFGLNETVLSFTKEMVRMCSQITEHEVERAKNQLKTHLMIQLDGTTPICEEIGRQMLVYGRRVPVSEMLARIDVG